MYFDLAELPNLLHGSRLTEFDRWRITRFERRDHLGADNVPLERAVREFVRAQGETEPIGSIRLLTQLRYWGYIMNPVSFYFCFSTTGTELVAVVAEVNNTPWGEQHSYLLKPHQFSNTLSKKQSLRKDFHVSPFMPMDIDYDWQVTTPNEQLNIQIANYREQDRCFDVSLSLRRQELTPTNFNRIMWQYPLMTWRVVGGIYWQAWRLWWKGAKFYPHPKRRHPLASANMETVKPY
jgi:DUF1365 family protein